MAPNKKYNYCSYTLSFALSMEILALLAFSTRHAANLVYRRGHNLGKYGN